MTITSNVTLHDGIVCYNQSIELTCHADGINVTMFKWMSSDKSIQSEHSTNITVIATNSLVEYTCTVSDINGNHGYSSVDILSNGKLHHPLGHVVSLVVHVYHIMCHHHTQHLPQSCIQSISM